jgi:predicted PhzF superfamily epimerase YddE/YHI9
VALEGDDDGPRPDTLDAACGARFVYLLPNFQNPSGRCLSAARRVALVDRAAEIGLPIVEDNPYGELWFDTPPPPPLAARAGDAAVYLGSFSKVLAPGLRLGYVVAPKALYPKLLQAKQAADLHTPGFNQRVVHEVIKDGFLHHARAHHPRPVQDAARRHAGRARGPPAGRLPWQTPVGGMFFWVTLPPQLDATALLPQAVAAGMAYVPGAPFFPQGGHANTLRLSFVTVPPEQIHTGVAALARVLTDALASEEPAMQRPFHQLDVFSAVPLKGNPLAVVHAAQGLDDTTMAAFARWTNLSETTFLLPPTDPAADYRVRIFTPGGELPFAGHPTLGSCHAWLAAGGRAAHPRRGGAGMWRGAGACAPARRPAGLCRAAAAPQRAAGRHAAGSASPRRWACPADMLQHQWVDNGPGWCAVMLPSSARRCGRCKPDWAALGDIKLGRGGRTGTGQRHTAFEVRALRSRPGCASKTRSPAA